ncbi:hypothetical protein L1887_46957 [Cichorium endivia]|nr:hypothetical protein L1887_46957 [Cichorium endivia]
MLADGARIDLRHGTASGRDDLVALGTLDLKAPRVGGATAGDIAIDASGRYDIQGAASISVYGMQRYTDAPLGSDPATSGKPYQVIDQTYLDGKHFESKRVHQRGVGQYRAIASATADGDLVVQGDIDLSGYRYASLNPRTQLDPSVYGSGEVGGLGVARRWRPDPCTAASTTVSLHRRPVPDDNGWLLVSGVQPFAADLVATRLAVEASLTAPYALAAGSVLGADIRDAGGTLLYAAGSLLEQTVTLPAGTRLGAGTLLVNSASVGTMRWPAGIALPSIAFSTSNTLVLGRRPDLGARCTDPFGNRP